jgi:hypothetical protein
VFNRVVARLRAQWSRSDEAGQSTAEYALVILGACALATLLITWATGSHSISKLFDSVINKILPG